MLKKSLAYEYARKTGFAHLFAIKYLKNVVYQFYAGYNHLRTYMFVQPFGRLQLVKFLENFGFQLLFTVNCTRSCYFCQKKKLIKKDKKEQLILLIKQLLNLYLIF